jgi:hypothetical protein
MHYALKDRSAVGDRPVVSPTSCSSKDGWANSHMLPRLMCQAMPEILSTARAIWSRQGAITAGLSTTFVGWRRFVRERG